MIAIMQPYFFPYLGYFQLIHAVDTYVNLDHVSFMKRSYMTRNTLKGGITINVPVWGGSQNKKCNEVLVNFSNGYIDTFFKKVQHVYGKETNYSVVMEQILLPEFIDREITISAFNFGIIKRICKYLNISTNLIDTSTVFKSDQLKRESALKFIAQSMGDSHYVNAIGGKSLYDKEDFKKDGIQLSFLQMDTVDIDNQYASILDLLFRYEKSHIVSQLNRYTLV
jgi:hypothetical protein